MGICHSNYSVIEPEQTYKKTSYEDRKTKVEEHDIVIAKLKIQNDRLDDRLKKLEKEEQDLHSEAMEFAKNKNKDRAIYCIGKIKRIRKYKKKTFERKQFIEKKTEEVENAQDDIEFTKVVNESNKVMKNLIDQINLEEIEIAKDLQKEGKMKKDELMELLEDDDQDLENEINNIEKEMIEQNFKEGYDNEEKKNYNKDINSEANKPEILLN